MSEEKYTSTIAQTVEATGDLLHNTPSGIVYFIITVGSLLGVLYFGVNRLELGLSNIDMQLKNIDRDLQRTTEALEENMAHVKPVTTNGRYIRDDHARSR
jgi:hypothetical protein